MVNSIASALAAQKSGSCIATFPSIRIKKDASTFVASQHKTVPQPFQREYAR
jgi:hypothetical protein